MAVEIKGLDSLMAKLNAMGGNVQEAVYLGVEETVEYAAGEAKAMKPYGSIAIQTETKMVPGGAEGKVFSNTPHAAFVEFGTGPKGEANHSGISPNVPVTYHPGPWVYKSEEYGWVTTSGQPAKPYLYPAAKVTEPRFVQIMEDALKKALRRAGG